MQLVTLAEAKERLSIDFDSKDGEIKGLLNAIEGYLINATGFNLKALKAEIDKAELKEDFDGVLPDESEDEFLEPISHTAMAEETEINQQLLATAYVAKEYVLLKAYLDYYGIHTEIDDLRLTNLMKQLQVSALGV